MGVSASNRLRTGGELEVSLRAPGMTALHRVGVAGLWMTLDALQAAPDLARPIREAGGEWTLGQESVSLRWSGAPDAFFQALRDASFRVDERHGLVHFPALGPPTASPVHAVLVQEALLGTFLQHGKTRRADPSSRRTVLASGDEDAQSSGAPPLRYRRMLDYAHRSTRIDLDRPNRLAGWQFPGGVVRHVGYTGDTGLEEPADRYLALLYAPVGAYYFQLRPRTQGIRPAFCLVLPEPSDLPGYADARRRFVGADPRTYVAAGGAEAAMRVLLHLRADALLEAGQFVRCRVVEFGVVAWASQQKTRVGLYDVAPETARPLLAFRAATYLLPPRLVTPAAGGDPFWSVPQVPELVARNAIAGRPWWYGFATFVDDLDRRKAVFGFERKGLGQMVNEQVGLEGSPEVIAFVEACHQAWRQRLRKIRERAQREGLDRALLEREYEQQRVAFARCKNAATLRGAVTDFWARAGYLPSLQERWRSVLPFLGPRWQEGRDLALLALASYRGGRAVIGESGDADETTAVEAGAGEEELGE